MTHKCIFAASLAAIACAGCSNINSSPQNTPTTQPTPLVNGQKPPAAGTSAPDKPVIYVGSQKARGDDNDLVAQPVSLGSQNPARDAMEALMIAKNSPLPPGTSLRGIKIEDGLATVDFSRDPVNDVQGESKQAQALNAILKTLGQFPNISHVQILVQGRSIPSLGESGSSGDDLPVIRASDVRQAKTSGGG